MRENSENNAVCRTKPSLSRPRPISAILKHLAADPRHYQIAVLGGLLALGLARLDFAVSPSQIIATLATALAVEALGVRWFRASRRETKPFDFRSPLITALSLCLILRASGPGSLALAAALAIGAKYLVRVGSRHVFNPANLGIVGALLFLPDVWASPGQWGTAPLLGFGFACLGTLVVTRAARADITFAFLVSYAGLLLSRALWLGDPIALPLHRLQSGALLLFAFFMISDPRTGPVSRSGRLVFAPLVAGLAIWIDVSLYWNNGVLWALALAAPMVPLLNMLLPEGCEGQNSLRKHGDHFGDTVARTPMLVSPLSGLEARKIDRGSLVFRSHPDLSAPALTLAPRSM